MTLATLELDRERPTAPAGAFPWERLRWLPLTAILGVQTVLSAQLMHLGYASGDEARYIYAGHQLIHEFWHGGGSPYFETYFSGAPDFYSPIAAVVDHFSGLIAVRLMSTMFMLATTTLLYATAARLFGYLPAVAGAALFAGFGLTHVLGAYADYDSLALMLTATATYCATRTGPGERHASRWLLALPLAILAANAAKYMTIVFDAPIVVLAALQMQPEGWRRVLKRCLILGTATGALLMMALYLAGTAYLRGIMFTTLNRPSGTQVIFRAVRQQPHVILDVTWGWIGIALALGAVAPLIAFAVPWERKRMSALIVLTVAGLLVTLEGLHLHTTESMRRHDDFSVWFACMAAGYTLGCAAQFGKNLYVRIATTALVIVVAVASAVHYTPTGQLAYPAQTNVTQVEAFGVLKPYLEVPGGRFLLGGLDDDLMLYTEHLNVPWYQHFDDVYIKYPIPGRGGDSHGQVSGRACLRLGPGCMYLEGVAGYRAAIRAHWFALITMIGEHGDGLPQDAAIEQAVRHTPGYVLLTRADNVPTWIYLPDYLEALSHLRDDA